MYFIIHNKRSHHLAVSAVPWVEFSYDLQHIFFFSVLASFFTLVTSVLVFVLIFRILDGWFADLGMEEVTLIHGVVYPADRFCITARHCRQDSKPCSHRGGTMPWGEVAAYGYGILTCLVPLFPSAMLRLALESQFIPTQMHPKAYWSWFCFHCILKKYFSPSTIHSRQCTV